MIAEINIDLAKSKAKELEKTYGDISKYCNVSATTVASWMMGKSKPREEKAYLLAECLGLEREELVINVMKEPINQGGFPEKHGKDVTTNPYKKDKPVSDKILTIQAEDDLIAKMDDYFKHHINLRSVAYLNSWLAFQKTILNNQKEVK